MYDVNNDFIIDNAEFNKFKNVNESEDEDDDEIKKKKMKENNSLNINVDKRKTRAAKLLKKIKSQINSSRLKSHRLHIMMKKSKIINATLKLQRSKIKKR